MSELTDEQIRVKLAEFPDPLFSPNHAIYIGNLKKRIEEWKKNQKRQQG